MDNLLISNASIIDGTGQPAYCADIAIKKNRITAIGQLQNFKSNHQIDAGKLSIIPGIIDPHSHAGLQGRSLAFYRQCVAHAANIARKRAGRCIFIVD